MRNDRRFEVKVAAVSAVIAGVCLARRRYLDLVTYAAVMAGILLMMLILKALFHVPRPAVTEHLEVAHGFSFPSGHALPCCGRCRI